MILLFPMKSQIMLLVYPLMMMEKSKVLLWKANLTITLRTLPTVAGTPQKARRPLLSVSPR